MSDASTPSAETLAERLLDAFDRSWREALEPPSISSFLGDAHRQGLPSDGLLQELVLIDLEYRWKFPERATAHPLGVAAGDRPSAEAYYALFPTLRDTVPLDKEVKRYAEKFGLAAAPFQATDMNSEAAATAIKDSSTETRVTAPINAPLATSPTGFHPADPRLRASGGARFDSNTFLSQRYQRIELLGTGAFGEVWRAEDTALQRTVAIKSLLLSSNSSESMARMLYEAQAAAAVTHPHLVTVYDVIQDDHGLHLVMEWAPGTSLDEWMKQRPPLPKIINALADVADALHSVHLAGLVHCDLKPANILVDQEGFARLTDFGLAVREQNQRALTGKLFGTPLYLSPEQVRGESHRLDGRADIWAIGTILYRVLTDRLPFSGQTQGELFDEIEFRAAKPPRQINDKAPEDLEVICLKCLRKNPEDRFATAADFASALRRSRCLSAVAAKPTFVSAPQPTHRMIGRDAIADAVAMRFIESRERLVTITGPGGMGKTRLASELSSRLASHFHGNIHWVELAEARDASSVCRAVRLALGLPAPQGDESASALADAMQLRESILLVLDNCEQVVEPLAPLVSKWLSSVRQLSILATSQAKLGVGGERRVPLEPLEYPPNLSDETGSSVPIQSFAAVELFAARAEQAGCPIANRAEDWDAVAEICRRLDGLPLALELAAARLPLLGVQGIRSKLKQSLAVLRTSRRDLPARQQTLEAAVAWSISLLEPSEQRVLSLIAMLPAAAPMDLLELLIETFFAEEVVGLQALQELEERSLLRRREVEGMVWFDLLSAIRRQTTAKSTLASERSSLDTVSLDTARIGLECIEYWRVHPVPNEVEWRDAVAANLWQSSQWCLKTHHVLGAAVAGRLADQMTADHIAAPLRVERLSTLVRALEATSLERKELAELFVALGIAQRAAGEGALAIQSALAAMQHASEFPFTVVAPRLLIAEVHFDSGEYASAKDEAIQAFDRYQTANESAGAARALALLGRIAWRTGQLHEAHERFEAALVQASRVANPSLRSEIIRDQGNVLLLHGRPDQALEKFLRAERLAVQANDRRAVRQAIVSHAAALAELGQYSDADALYAKAERLSRLLGDRRGLAMVLNNRGLALVDQGLTDNALKMLEDAEILYRQVGHTAGSTICLAAQGAAYLARRDAQAALRRFDQAMHQLPSIAGSLHEAVIHIDLAAALALLGDASSAEQNLAVAQATLERLQAVKSPEGFLCAAQQALLSGNRSSIAAARQLANELGLSEQHPRQRIRDTYRDLVSSSSQTP